MRAVICILPRGNWLDDSGEIVQANTPALLPALTASGKRPTRLDLANWLVSPENPLTARVFVNRVWKLFFGHGIVRSVEDFGIQGTLPTHPELLDWLASEFTEAGSTGEPGPPWDIKRLVRLIVTSRTYRQSSVPGALARDRDPTNQWLARQGRFRLDAELVRDNALAVSGLLVRKIGGPSVKPYQPAGYWQFLNFPKRDWTEDRGEDQYRRGMYTYWQRTFLHPSLLAFDAPTREECTADRPRSSTPLQALVLLNDPTYAEAARTFAERIIREGGATLPNRSTLPIAGRCPARSVPRKRRSSPTYIASISTITLPTRRRRSSWFPRVSGRFQRTSTSPSWQHGPRWRG